MTGFALGISSLVACALTVASIGFIWIEKEKKAARERQKREMRERQALAERQSEFKFPERELASAGR